MELNDIKIKPVLPFLIDVGHKTVIAYVEYSKDKVHFSAEDRDFFSEEDLKSLESLILKKIDKKVIQNSLNIKMPNVDLSYDNVYKNVTKEKQDE
jgi:hypothetical protein